MTTTTWDVPFATTQQTHSASKLHEFLSLLVAKKSSQPIQDMMSETTSQGLTDDEVAAKKEIASALRFSLRETPELERWSISSASQEIRELCDIEKRMLVLMGSMPAEIEQTIGVEAEMLDWEMSSRPKEREKRSLPVALHYAGRGKPLLDPDPWT